MNLTNDEITTYWKIDSIRCLKNCVSSLSLFAFQVRLQNNSKGQYYREMADKVQEILDEFKESISEEEEDE